jgi:hypothetical protein
MAVITACLAIANQLCGNTDIILGPYNKQMEIKISKNEALLLGRRKNEGINHDQNMKIGVARSGMGYCD